MELLASTGADLPAPGPHPSPLTHDQRTVMVLVDSAGLAAEEVASALGLPPGIVRSRLAGARRALWTRSPVGASARPGAST